MNPFLQLDRTGVKSVGSGAVSMKHLLVFVLAVLVGAPALFAQGNPYPSNPTGGERSATIQGQVTLPNGKPAPNVYLRLQPEGVGGLVQSASTDSSGNFTFSGQGISSGANYLITANIQGYAPVHKMVMVTGPDTYVSIGLVAAPGAKPLKPGVAPVIPIHKLAIPPKALAEYNKGLQSLDKGKTADAESAFKKAIQIYPKYADSYLRLSAIYADQSRFSEAQKAIDHATKIAKDSPESFAYLGYLYMKEKQPQKAEKSFQKSIEMGPNDWFAQLELGRLLYKRKDYMSAYPHFLQARKLHPQIASVHLMLYDDLIHLNKLKEALTELDDFVARFPKNPQADRMRKVRPALAAAAAKQH
jgi:TolA-binding protein